MRCDYPGNIRELRNILERASLLTDGPGIARRDLAAMLGISERTLYRKLRELERWQPGTAEDGQRSSR